MCGCSWWWWWSVAGQNGKSLVLSPQRCIFAGFRVSFPADAVFVERRQDSVLPYPGWGYPELKSNPTMAFGHEHNQSDHHFIISSLITAVDNGTHGCRSVHSRRADCCRHRHTYRCHHYHYQQQGPLCQFDAAVNGTTRHNFDETIFVRSMPGYCRESMFRSTHCVAFGGGSLFVSSTTTGGISVIVFVLVSSW